MEGLFIYVLVGVLLFRLAIWVGSQLKISDTIISFLNYIKKMIHRN